MSQGSLQAGYFRFHGPWAPGVRLLRTLDFRAKAALVTLCFLLPLTLLGAAYWQSTGVLLDATRQERVGLQLERLLAPWLGDAQTQRLALAQGSANQPDLTRLQADAAAFRALAEQRLEGVEVDQALATVQERQAALVREVALLTSASGHDWLPAMDAYVQALMALHERLVDNSQLALDPEAASYHLMLLATSALPEAIEQVSRAQETAAALARSGGGTAPPWDLHGHWHQSLVAVDAAEEALQRAELARAGLKDQQGLGGALTAVQRYREAAKAAWFGDQPNWDQPAVGEAAQAALVALRAARTRGAELLDGLLAEREAAAVGARWLTGALVALSLFMAGYLFYCFYLVIRGGMHEVQRHLQAMTEGDLTTRPRPWGQDEAAQLMTHLSTMQDSLAGLVHRVRHTAQGLATASREIADASNDLSQRSEVSASRLQASASAMMKLSAQVGDTSDRTHSASELVGRNAQAAMDGGRCIGEVVNTMHGVRSASTRIGDIIGVIDSIAFQTNILALNASVEAARAGEQGRGFQVVASEVRALAQRSANAAHEIKDLINDSVGRIVAGSQGVDEAGQSMQELVIRAEEMEGLMAAVLQGSRQQRDEIVAVETSIQQLDQQTQQNAALVEETAAAAASLLDQARGLVAQVERFRLPEAA